MTAGHVADRHRTSRRDPDAIERLKGQFPDFRDLPYTPFRSDLYTVDDLYEGFDADRPSSYEDTPDAVVYRHWLDTGGAQGCSVVESLARRIHDHSITEAIEDFIEGREVVAIMGGHGLRRDDPGYRAVTSVSRALARTGKLMVSGGGPGAMEATHVGAWMARRTDDDLDVAIGILGAAPTYEPAGEWLASAFEVRERFPRPDDANGSHHGAGHDPEVSLGIPTWLYGHEPPNAFATHIAKYFANAIREDGLLTIARHGVVFTPGSAGTVQEIFQDATQNHYETVGPPSPMVFFGVDYWTSDLPVLPLIRRLGRGKPWLDEILVTDEESEAVDFIESHRR